MQHQKHDRLHHRLALCVLALALGGGPSAPAARAQGGPRETPAALPAKLAPDLHARLRGARGDERADLIVQFKETREGLLDALLGGLGGRVTRRFRRLGAHGVRLPLGAAEALAARPEVSYVSPDRPVSAAGHLTATTGADAARTQTRAGLLGLPTNTYLDGAGVGIAVVDSGIDPGHESFRGGLLGLSSRVALSRDFTGEGRTDDPYGHGTHVASIAAGGDLSGGAYAGIAPAASLYNLRVLDSHGRGSVSGVLAALDWVLANKHLHGIRVVNLSLGTTAVDAFWRDPVCQAVRQLTDAGVVVVAAAGNRGKDGEGNKVYGQVHSPGVEPAAITVGGANSFGSDSRAGDAVATYSSRGPTRGSWTDDGGVRHYDNLIKPDLVAPANRLIAAQAAGNYLVTTNPELDVKVAGSTSRDQMYLSGSSMATPVVAGAAALLKQANPSLTPNLVKMILMYTAQPLAGFNQLEQGAGLVNLEGALRLARLIRTDLSAATPVGDPLLCAGCAEPSPVSTVAGQQFYWGRGVILDNTFATGNNLVLKYQSVYGLGVVLADATPYAQGVVMADGVTISEGVIMTDGITFSESILTSNGTTLDAGSIFCPTGVIMADGVMLADGVIMADGGRVLGDGVMLSDGVVLGDVSAQAGLALIAGDNTQAMGVTLDGTPAGLKAAAASKSQINLTWADAATNETGYRVERSTDGTAFSVVATLGANATSYASAGHVANTRYYYRVQAFNARGVTNYSATVSALIPRK